MSLTYDKLRARIGHKAGYGLTVSSFVGNQASLVEQILERGLARFYDPPVLPGERDKHQWSFLTPTITIDLVASQYAYPLPHGFASFMGPLMYAPGQNDFYPPIEIMGAEEVQRRLGYSDDTGRPCIGGIRVLNSIDIHKTAWELIVHPVPDAAYQVKGQAKLNPVLPGESDDVLLGGQPHENTIIEACLAETVAFLDDLDDGGSSERRFLEFLASSISHDRHVTGAQTVGYVGDPGLADWRDVSWGLFATDPRLTFMGMSNW